MKHTFLALLLVALSGCGLFRLPPPATPEPEAPKVDPVARAVKNTIALAVKDGETYDLFCSGVAVDGTFLTAEHCTKPGEEFFVLFRGRWYPGALVASDPEHDLAVIDAVGAKVKDSLEVSPWEPEYGMFIVFLGFPLGDPHLHFSAARVSAPVDSSDGYLFDVDGQFLPGNSGGPVLDERGRLIGIVSSTYALPGFPVPQFLPIGHAVRPEYIREILK